MDYQWHPKLVIENMGDKAVFINPAEGTVVTAEFDDKDKVDAYLQGKIDTVSETLLHDITAFKKSKMLIPVDLVEEQDDMIIHSVYLCLTKKCNLQCDFCCISSGPYVYEENQMDLYQIKRIIDQLSQYKVGGIILTGGEPLLRKDLVEIIHYINDNLKCKVFLSTNGLLLNTEFIDEIRGMVRRIDISVENLFTKSMESERGKLCQMFSRLREREIKLGFSFVLNRNTKAYLCDFLDFAAQHNGQISLKVAAPIGRARKNSHLLLTREEVNTIYLNMYKHILQQKYDHQSFHGMVRLPLYPRYSCSAKGKILAIYPDGEVYSCHSLEGPEFSLGNIINLGLAQILANRSVQAKSPLYCQCFEIDQNSTCNTCQVRYFCMGICYGELYKNQNHQTKSVLCNIIYNLIRFNLIGWQREMNFLDNLQKLITFIEEDINNNLYINT